ncbi:Metaxin-2 [Schistosoma japonicum]|uniref:Metaxin-2 n=1 Tax=Schistosoma japonicum TaxID=6182 RepID=A0A4Z2CRB0_SCHJA|nr:Metaxin-2 [Schistosoma japonicum]
MSKLILLTHPHQVILPSDDAATRSVVCYLAGSGLPFHIDYILNADSCSHDHLLPVTILNGSIVTGYTSLCLRLHILKTNSNINFDNSKLASRNLRHAYLFWISDVLRNVMIYFTWLNESTYTNFTYKRIESATPHLLAVFIAKRKRQQHLRFLKSIGWDKLTITDVLKNMEALCLSIVELLGNGPFLFERNTPGKIDALLYGHWTVFYEFSECFSELKSVLDKYSVIINLIQRVAETCNQPFSRT